MQFDLYVRVGHHVGLIQHEGQNKVEHLVSYLRWTPLTTAMSQVRRAGNHLWHIYGSWGRMINNWAWQGFRDQIPKIAIKGQSKKPKHQKPCSLTMYNIRHCHTHTHTHTQFRTRPNPSKIQLITARWLVDLYTSKAFFFFFKSTVEEK